MTGSLPAAGFSLPRTCRDVAPVPKRVTAAGGSALRLVFLVAVLLCLVGPLRHALLLTSDTAASWPLFGAGDLSPSRFSAPRTLAATVTLVAEDRGQINSQQQRLAEEDRLPSGINVGSQSETAPHGHNPTEAPSGSQLGFERTMVEDGSPLVGERASDTAGWLHQSGGLAPADIELGDSSFGKPDVSGFPGGSRSYWDQSSRQGRTKFFTKPNTGFARESRSRQVVDVNTAAGDSIPNPRRFPGSGGSLSMSLGEFTSILPEVERDGVIVLTLSTAPFYAFLKNWDCYARRILGRQFLVLTNDAGFGEMLAAMDGLHVLVQDTTASVEGADGNPLLVSANFGTLAYQRLMLSRTELVAQLLGLNRSVLIADNDAVWISDPFPTLAAHGDAHIMASDDGDQEAGRGVLCGGFLFLRHSMHALRIWSEVLRRHRDLVHRAERLHRLEHRTESEQSILNDLVGEELRKARRLDNTDASASTEQRRMQAQPLSVVYLDQRLFPSGRQYFGRSRPASADAAEVQPIVVHNNWVVGGEKKIERFKRHKLWALRNSFPLALQPGSTDEEAHVATCNLPSYIPVKL